MALVDPYALCPCGSLQKYKWCCQKSEAAAIRVERLIQNQQLDQALRIVDESLTKDPKSFWLLGQKAYIHQRRDEVDAARGVYEQVLALKPDHQGAWAGRVILNLSARSVQEAAYELQLALAACSQRGTQLLVAIEMVAIHVAREGRVLAAMAHFNLLDDGEEYEPSEAASAVMGELQLSPRISPWVKQLWEILPPPDDLREDWKAKFEEARQEAARGLWARAAARFEVLAAAGVDVADRNQGICRLYILDQAGGVAALRRYIAKLGNTIEAVDLEGLAQDEMPPSEEGQLDVVRMTWPVRNRDALLEILRGLETTEKTVIEGNVSPLDPNDPDSPELPEFHLLDRPVPTIDDNTGVDALPQSIGQVLVGEEHVHLLAIDNDRLDDLRDRFIHLAGMSIPPAHPKTRVTNRIPAVTVAMRSNRIMPPNLDPKQINRLRQLDHARLYGEVWPNTPLPILGGRTPKDAAADPSLEVPLRAALLHIEVMVQPGESPTAFPNLRDMLGVPEEPTPEPESVGLTRMNGARLHLVPFEKISEEALLQVYMHARMISHYRALEQAARAILGRSEILSKMQAADRVTFSDDLVTCLLYRGDRQGALDVVAEGRKGEPAAHRPANAVHWDLLQLRVLMNFESPEVWVPELAAILDRYRENRDANSVVLSKLLQLGLIKAQPHPDNPQQILIDPSILQAILERYGPRVVTASGTLGVSATRPEVWTPEKSTGGSGGIWTPGSSNPPGEDRPKLIIPG